jgi:dTMP kinase
MSCNFIVFEGIDGAGKSTQISNLSARLRKQDLTTIELCEPTYGEHGRIIRKHVLRQDPISVQKQIELFTRDRREHVRTRIKPLRRFIDRYPHFVVLQHRYYLSAPAYQAFEPAEMLALLRSQQAIEPKPDIVFLIDIPAQVALQRLKSRGQGLGLFDNVSTLEAVRQRYMALYKKCDEPIKIIDGLGSIEQVNDRVWKALKPKLLTKSRSAA